MTRNFPPTGRLGVANLKKAEPGSAELRPEIQNGLVAVATATTSTTAAAASAAVFTTTAAAAARAFFAWLGDIDR